ncbi:MAG: SdiA-regulated domain-containing protein [Cellvibrionaceae bacterium]
MSIMIKSALAATLLTGAAGTFHGLDLDDQLLYQYQAWSTPEQTRNNSVWLPDYQVDVEAVVLKNVRNNLSGITYNRDTQSLWVVINQPSQLIELNEDLQPKRTIPLVNFHDTEAVAYAGQGRFAIADERIQTVAIAIIDEKTQSLDKDDLPQLTLNTRGEDNKGLEGLAVNPSDHSIYAVRERDPMELLKIQGLLEKSHNIGVHNPFDISTGHIYWDDLSGLHFDPATQNLLVLSDEAKLLSVVNPSGDRITHMDLEAGFGGLSADIPQAEGVTLDDHKNLYIVSEPNLIYRFKPR